MADLFPAEEARRLPARGYSLAEVHRLLVLEGRVCREVGSRRKCVKYKTPRRKVGVLLEDRSRCSASFNLIGWNDYAVKPFDNLDRL